MCINNKVSNFSKYPNYYKRVGRKIQQILKKDSECTYLGMAGTSFVTASYFIIEEVKGRAFMSEKCM